MPLKRDPQMSGVGDASSRLKFTVGPDEENVSSTTQSDIAGKRSEKVPAVTKTYLSNESNDISGTASAVFSTPKKDSADSSASVFTPALHKSASK